MIRLKIEQSQIVSQVHLRSVVPERAAHPTLALNPKMFDIGSVIACIKRVGVPYLA